MNFIIGSLNGDEEQGSSDCTVNTDCLTHVNDAVIVELEAEIERLKHIIQQHVDLQFNLQSKVDELQNEIKTLRGFPALPQIPHNPIIYT